MLLKLSRPLVTIPAAGDRPETTVAEINLKFDELTGADYILCEQLLIGKLGMVTMVDPRLSPTFQVEIASRACGIAVERLRTMALDDFGALMAVTRDFFVATA